MITIESNNIERCSGCVCQRAELRGVRLDLSGGRPPFVYSSGAELRSELLDSSRPSGTGCKRLLRLHIRFWLTLPYRDQLGTVRTATAEFTRCVPVEVPAGVFGCQKPDISIVLLDVNVNFTTNTATLWIGIRVCPKKCIEAVNYEYDEGCGCGCGCNNGGCGCSGSSMDGITLPYSMSGMRCPCERCRDDDGWYSSDLWLTPSGASLYADIGCCASTCSCPCAR